MNNSYLRTLLSFVILLAILIFIDLSVGWAGKKYMVWLNNTPRDSDAALVNYNVNSASPDVAVIGSSTAICHYDPDIIRDSLMSWWGEDLEVMNMGVSNQRLTYGYYGLKCLLDRTTPKLVIMDVWASYIGKGDPSFSFEAFRPYIKINSNIKEMMKKHGEYDFMSWSSMYCFNTELFKLLMSVFKKSGANGFSKNRFENNKILKSNEKDSSDLLPLSVEEFDAMIALAKSKKIPLLIVMSPTLRGSDTASKSYLYIEQKCKENGIALLDYSNDEKYYQPHYFRDNTHLNYYGAEFFSQELMKDIRHKVLEISYF